MIQAVIIDDEQNAINSLEWDLKKFADDVSVVQTFTEPEEAIKYLNTHNVDVVFLDIEMPSMDGFTLLEKIDDISFGVIFVTAYNEYALKAIRKNAFDYLLKPVDSKHLKEAIERVKQSKFSLVSNDSLEQFMKDFNIKNKKEKISVYTDGCLIFLKTDDIIYAEADGNYTRIVSETGKEILISKKIKELEKSLVGCSFYRVHQSYLVNINKIKKLYKTEGSVVMENDRTIPVSRQKRNELLNYFL